jgi:membrane protease subunit (stomatin/prohibitin family)
MGIFDGLGNELKQQFIVRPDEAKNLVVYKWPETNIRMLTMVTVQPDEFAFFVNKGQVAGYLPGGQHKLDGAQIPFLGGLIDRATGGNVLMSELYFVSSRNFANVKFGSSLSDVKDPATEMMIRCGVYGALTYKVVDPAKLILNLIGTQGITDNSVIEDGIKSILAKRLREIINAMLTKEKWDILDVTGGGHTTEFEQAIAAVVNHDLAGEGSDWGLTLVGIQDFVVSINDEDVASLQELHKQMAGMKLAGSNAEAYRAMTQGQAILNASEGQMGQGGGMAGLFAGVGIGQGIMGGMGQAAPAAPPAAVAASAPVPQAVVVCQGCGAQNPQGMKFCGGCGKPLGPVVKTCAKCGAEVPAGMKFCGSCGTPVVE